jgi:peptide/nickel transport system permease protein
MRRTGRGSHILAYALAALVMVYASYLLPRMLPGDFVSAMYSSSHVTLSAAQEQELRSYYTGRDGFVWYLKDLVTLEWGYSYAFLSPISRLILQALPWTLLLMGSAHVLSMIAGFFAGVEAAWRRGSVTEKYGVGIMTVLQGIPEIGTGVILLMVFAFYLGWFPAAGGETAYADLSGLARVTDILKHLALPFTTLFLAYFPGNFLLTRAGMVMILRKQYLETARAKGLPPMRVRYAHAARNALLPMVTRFGLRIAFMVTGALVIETIYSYPGLGTLLFNAISQRDLPLVQGIVLFSSLAILLINLALESAYGFLDPRVRHAS